MEQNEQKEEGLTLEQIMKVSEELTMINSKKIAEKGALVVDMVPIMASTVVLMIESAGYAVGQEPEEMYDYFNKCLKKFIERVDNIKKKIGEVTRDMPQA